jgi:hypothetical protein
MLKAKKSLKIPKGQSETVKHILKTNNGKIFRSKKSKGHKH